ncbi:hypothetical protein TRICI_005238 [Trichomonascus ciferrii]|uniref:Protein DML1 n=1 Tax=Trichomonascus ciferrii TaxID=44093 RepID=A0A642UUC4_9ASCO|nr:hypothetical protein TRICI_005238 [Trichomonascus ciferrii]
MHEIVHLSLSSSANHVHTHFYNAQEQYFVYSEEEARESKVDPHVLFRSGKAPVPRSLVWEMRGGYGGMRGFNHPLYDYDRDVEGNEVDNAIVWTDSNVELVKAPTIPRSEYQRALDQGQPVPKLDSSNTCYWSDYLHMYYHPSSLLTLSNWEFHPTEYPKGRSRGAGNAEFKDFSVGVDQYEEMNRDKEYLETNFRPVLETCDSLSGISLTTEVDSGWGGFSSQILAELRDDYLPKTPVFSWALYEPDNRLTREMTLSRIRSTVSLVDNSSVFIPMGKPTLPAGFPRPVDLSSQYYVSALQNVVFESFSVLSSLRHDRRVSMQEIADAVQCGTNRNVVSDVNCAIGDTGLINFSPDAFKPAGSSHVFSKIGLIRPPKEAPNPQPTQPQNIRDLYSNPTPLLNTVSSDGLWDSYFQRNRLLEAGTPESCLTKFECPQPFTTPSSFPKGLVTPQDHIYADMGVTTATRTTFKTMADFVSRVIRTDIDREDLKQALNTLADEYQHGYNSDSDSDDD